MISKMFRTWFGGSSNERTPSNGLCSCIGHSQDPRGSGQQKSRPTNHQSARLTATGWQLVNFTAGRGAAPEGEAWRNLAPKHSPSAQTIRLKTPTNSSATNIAQVRLAKENAISSIFLDIFLDFSLISSIFLSFSSRFLRFSSISPRSLDFP